MNKEQAKLALELSKQFFFAARVANEMGKSGQAEQLFAQGLNILTKTTEELT